MWQCNLEIRYTARIARLADAAQYATPLLSVSGLSFVVFDSKILLDYVGAESTQHLLELIRAQACA